jgi:hypothetical protein
MTEAEIEAHVDATAAVLGLPLAPEHRPGVVRYFALAAQMAGQLMGLPLGIEDEPASVFLPVAPSSGGAEA